MIAIAKRYENLIWQRYAPVDPLENLLLQIALLEMRDESDCVTGFLLERYDAIIAAARQVMLELDSADVVDAPTRWEPLPGSLGQVAVGGGYTCTVTAPAVVDLPPAPEPPVPDPEPQTLADYAIASGDPLSVKAGEFVKYCKANPLPPMPGDFSAEALKQAMEARAINTPGLARMLGINAQTAYNWVKGTTKPTGPMIPKLRELIPEAFVAPVSPALEDLSPEAIERANSIQEAVAEARRVFNIPGGRFDLVHLRGGKYTTISVREAVPQNAKVIERHERRNNGTWEVRTSNLRREGGGAINETQA